MRRPVLVLILCFLAGLLAWSELRVSPEVEVTDEAGEKAPATPKPPREPAAAAPAPSVLADAPPAPVSDAKTGPRYKRAYMLTLDKGALTFMQQEDIEGDFAPQRRKPEEWSGMLRCRLLSATNAVLAEELLPAPDYVCAVLDPKSGSDKPVPYTVAGPVVFQVRLPRVKGATRLDIFRIIQPGEPAIEGLLGSIPLPRS